MDVKKTTKGPQVYLSRSHPGLVKRLFELQVPEIREGIVEIRSISREAGSRTKIAVSTADPGCRCGRSMRGTEGQPRTGGGRRTLRRKNRYHQLERRTGGAGQQRTESRKGGASLYQRERFFRHGGSSRLSAVSGHRQRRAECASRREALRVENRYQESHAVRRGGGTYDSLRTEADDDAGEDFIAYGEENTFAEEESYEAFAEDSEICDETADAYDEDDDGIVFTAEE